MSREGSRGAGASQESKRPWYFEKTGPAFFNEWTLTHLGWGMLYQLVFPNRRVTGLVLHTIYESIEGYIFPAKFRDTSMRNHVGDTIAFTVGMLVVPSPSKRSSSQPTKSPPDAGARPAAPPSVGRLESGDRR